MLHSFKLSFFIFFLAPIWVAGQNPSLLFPINPGTPNTLAGTMGELRSTHFHTGIDIRTGGQEGLPVLAADNGYIVRIAVNPGGYGNAIYIKHPNGHTTVYAHLKEFRKDIAAYVRQQQYKKRVFKLNVYPGATLFKVSRGDTIARSGNSGSSGGPHLHFDVRNRNQNLLNPLHYGFNEIADTRPPVARQLAINPVDANSRINGCFERFETSLVKDNEGFKANDTIYALGNIALELYAYDRMNGTRFKTGISKIEVSINNTMYFVTDISSWPFSKSRQFYNYINYQELVKTGKRYHKLYIDEGNTLDFYPIKTNQGIITIEEGKVYHISIDLYDTYKNQSTVSFILKGGKKHAMTNAYNSNNNWEIFGNVLTIKTMLEDTVSITVGNSEHRPVKVCTTNDKAIYSWDISKGLPTLICINEKQVPLHFKAFVPAGSSYTFYSPLADIRFSSNSLFKNMYLWYRNNKDTLTGFDILEIGQPNLPLYKNITVHYKPQKEIPNKTIWGMYSIWGTNASYLPSTWTQNQISFKTRNFGTFKLLADSIPPNITPISLSKNKLTFKITDNLSGIKSINCYVNGNWVLMNYDPKKNLIWSEKEHSTDSFIGSMTLKITDNQGNEAVFEKIIK